MVVNQFAGDAGDGLLACRIDIYQDDFVQQGKAVGEIFVEITGTCVEVRLENSRQLLVPIEGTHGEYALFYLGRMVRIVAQENHLVVLYLEIETTVYSAETCHTSLYFFISQSAHLRQSHGGYPVLNVDADGDTQLYIGDISQG